MEFVLTPHVKSILCGRDMCIDGTLLCVAEKCLFHPSDSPDPNFGRSIEIKGYIVCPRCKVRTSWHDGAEWNEQLRKTIMRCKACKMAIPRKQVIWTQKVISKHRRTKHRFYHKECYEATFINSEESEEEALWSGTPDEPDKELVRLIRWAEKNGF